MPRLVVALLLWGILSGVCLAAPSANQPVPQSPPDPLAEFGDRLRPIQEMDQRKRQLLIQVNEIEGRIAQIRRNPDPQIQRMKEELDQLEKRRGQAQAELAEAKGRGIMGFALFNLGLGLLGLSPLFLGLVVLIFLLMALYLYRRKRDVAFTIPLAPMRASLWTTLAGQAATPGQGGWAHLWGLILPWLAGAALVLLLLLFWSSPAFSSTQPQEQGMATWEVDKHSFEQNASDLKQVMASQGMARLAFILEHPQGQRLDLARTTPLWDKNALRFQRHPALNFTGRYVRVNSFEHYFLLGRIYYEINEPAKAFRFLDQSKDLRAHPPDNPQAAPPLVLNLLKIALKEKWESHFTELEALFLSSATDSLRADYAAFLIFEADQTRGMQLLARLTKDDPRLAMGLLARIVEKRGALEALVFMEASLNVLVQGNLNTDGFVELCHGMWGELPRQTPGQGTLLAQYAVLLKKAWPRTHNGMTRLQALGDLIEAGESEFARSELGQLWQREGARFPVEAYLLMVDLHRRLGDESLAATLLENAYNQVFAADSRSLMAVFRYCLEKNDLSRAAKALNNLLGKFPQLKPSPAEDKLLERLGVNLPLPNQGLTMQGISGLLQQRLANRDLARSEMEAAVKLHLERALRSYSQDMLLNLNEVFHLLALYRDQMDSARMQALLPIGLEAVDRYRQANEKGLQDEVAKLEKRAADLSATLRKLAPSPEELRAEQQRLEREVDDLQSEAGWVRFRNGVHETASVLVLVMAALVFLAAQFFIICRASHHARGARNWKMGVFLARWIEGDGFALLMTLVFAPVGAVMALVGQLVLRLFKEETQAEEELDRTWPHPLPVNPEPRDE